MWGTKCKWVLQVVKGPVLFLCFRTCPCKRLCVQTIRRMYALCLCVAEEGCKCELVFNRWKLFYIIVLSSFLCNGIIVFLHHRLLFKMTNAYGSFIKFICRFGMQILILLIYSIINFSKKCGYQWSHRKEWNTGTDEQFSSLRVSLRFIITFFL